MSPKENIKFISYTGRYPNLCRGILTLEINGERVSFGLNSIEEKDKKIDYPPFWESGGECGFYNNYTESYTHKSKWIINKEEFPDKYKKYFKEIEEIFNENIPWGCCGGCL